MAARLRATSFPGPFPWLGGAPPPSQGKGPGNEVDSRHHLPVPISVNTCCQQGKMCLRHCPTKTNFRSQALFFLSTLFLIFRMHSSSFQMLQPEANVNKSCFDPAWGNMVAIDQQKMFFFFLSSEARISVREPRTFHLRK